LRSFALAHALLQHASLPHVAPDFSGIAKRVLNAHAVEIGYGGPCPQWTIPVPLEELDEDL
jgi:hypothetical protein